MSKLLGVRVLFALAELSVGRFQDPALALAEGDARLIFSRVAHLDSRHDFVEDAVPDRDLKSSRRRRWGLRGA